ncbi:hypothetical protein FF36_00160 [Frankia torreyi]|uniref:Uncharacterized protein n=1 Tax=Frankia torreyi TaxID=1856 RepID=A0A0D8BNF1_9ACTN|nr:hypothetical protein [Frankia torreyi]KJE25544.1 hypothetical protein FF36_00160 [Frankia torreyi]
MTDPADFRTEATHLANQARAWVDWLGEPKLTEQFAERAQIAALTSIALSLAALAATTLSPTGPTPYATPVHLSWESR